MGQFLLWVSFIGPWFLLIPLDTKRVKRFLSVAFFTVFLTSINWQIAEILDWWTVKENLFFLTNILSVNYGLLPASTILIFYFTYPKAWLFFGTNILLEAFQAFIVGPFVYEKLGIYSMDTLTNFGAFLSQLVFVPIIYFYQKWYDRGHSKY